MVISRRGQRPGGFDAGDRVEAVAVAVLRRGTSALLCLRAPGRESFPGVWDFPGGHVEAGESAAEALRRELVEELGIGIMRPGPIPDAFFRLGEAEISLWVLDEWTGEPENLAPEEHVELRWVDIEEAAGLDLPDASYHDLLARFLKPRG